MDGKEKYESLESNVRASFDGFGSKRVCKDVFGSRVNWCPVAGGWLG